MIIALEREEGIEGSEYSLVCIVNSALRNIVEEVRNNVINEKTHRVQIPKQKLESTLNWIVQTTGLTRKLVSVSTVNNEEGDIYIDTYSYNNYIVAKNTSVYPYPPPIPNSITFTIKSID